MKKIILSILIITGTASMQSCKDQFEDQLMELKTESSKTSGGLMHKNSDSTKNAVYLQNVISDPITADPPPKDRGQW